MKRHPSTALSFAGLIAILVTSSAALAAAPQTVVIPSRQVPTRSAGKTAGKTASSSSSSEDWKSAPSSRDITFGFLGGTGLIEPKYGLSVIGDVAKKILNQGFIPGIDNQVFIELEAGPIFVQGHAPLFWSSHLRWDFTQDENWSFYALGGLAGQITGIELGDRALIFPRFGAGVFYHLQQNMSIRAELSHELIGAGLSFEF